MQPAPNAALFLMPPNPSSLGKVCLPGDTAGTPAFPSSSFSRLSDTSNQDVSIGVIQRECGVLFTHLDLPLEQISELQIDESLCEPCDVLQPQDAWGCVWGRMEDTFKLVFEKRGTL